MKKLKMVIAVAILLAAAFLYSHVAKKNLIYDNTIDSSSYMGHAMADETEICQTFRTRESALDGFYLKLTTAGDISRAHVILTLTDVETGKEEAQVTINAASIRSGKFVVFPLEKTLTGTAGKSYNMSLKAVGTDAYNYVAMYYQYGTMPDTSLTIGGVTTDGTMIARTVTNRFDAETFVIFLVIIAFIYGFMKLLYRLFK